VRALGHCGECHTPRDPLGGPEDAFFLAGSPNGADNKRVPNITPDDETGIGEWSVGDIAEFLSSGMDPEGDFAGGAMGAVIRHSTSLLAADDRRAIAAYLLSLPPLPSQARR
jgi:mono/diheme cytochrome c family protein